VAYLDHLTAEPTGQTVDELKDKLKSALEVVGLHVSGHQGIGQVTQDRVCSRQDNWAGTPLTLFFCLWALPMRHSGLLLACRFSCAAVINYSQV